MHTYVCASWQFVEALPKRAVLNRSYEQLKIIFNMADTDKSGRVSQQEFFTWSLNYAAKSSGAGMVKIFSRYDPTERGYRCTETLTRGRVCTTEQATPYE